METNFLLQEKKRCEYILRLLSNKVSFALNEIEEYNAIKSSIKSRLDEIDAELIRKRKIGFRYKIFILIFFSTATLVTFIYSSTIYLPLCFLFFLLIFLLRFKKIDIFLRYVYIILLLLLTTTITLSIFLFPSFKEFLNTNNSYITIASSLLSIIILLIPSPNNRES